jgi:hypothetical protein
MQKKKIEKYLAVFDIAHQVYAAICGGLKDTADLEGNVYT